MAQQQAQGDYQSYEVAECIEYFDAACNSTAVTAVAYASDVQMSNAIDRFWTLYGRGEDGLAVALLDGPFHVVIARASELMDAGKPVVHLPNPHELRECQP